MFQRTTTAALCLALMSTVLGCGGGGSSREKPDTVSVSGTVMLKGKPLAGADVNFVSPDGGFAGYGVTDDQGAFTLVQGAVVGTNKVYISKLEGEGVELDPEEGMDAGQLEAMSLPGDPAASKKGPAGPKQLVPEQFSNPEKSKLTFDVPAEGTDQANFKL